MIETEPIWAIELAGLLKMLFKIGSSSENPKDQIPLQGAVEHHCFHVLENSQKGAADDQATSKASRWPIWHSFVKEADHRSVEGLMGSSVVFLVGDRVISPILGSAITRTPPRTKISLTMDMQLAKAWPGIWSSSFAG